MSNDIVGRKAGQVPDAPEEASDTLRTAASAKVLDLLGEGEWEGLVDGPASIYFDDTPVAVRDATEPDGYKMNFKGVKWAWRAGLPDQPYIPLFSEASHEASVGVEVKNGVPVVRTVTDQNVDAIAVRISLPGLQQVDGDGNILGSHVTVQVWVRAHDDTDFVLKGEHTIRGKASTTYEKAFVHLLHGTGPWQVKVIRTSPNATDNNRNQTVWAGYTEIIYARLRYPYSVLMGLEFDAAYFDAVPVRGYDVKMLKIKVPLNRIYDADTDTVTYLGPWDGRLKTAREWSDNPAWCVYDVLTANRYGLGKYLTDGNEILVDKAMLYQIGKYCDEKVNGRRRFSCNVYFQTQLDAYDFINQMASIFRGMAMWASGMVTFSQDAPADAEYLFNNTNVEGGQFTYQSNSRRERVTAAYVYWVDPEQGYRRVLELVEDRAAILRYGYNPANVNAVGCANREQAIQMGRWMIYGSCYEPNSVTFKSGLVAPFLRPGMIIQLQDEHRAGKRLAGRVREVPGAYQVTLDQDVVLDAGQSYVLKLVFPRGESGLPKVYEALVTTPPGRHRTIEHVGGFPSLPERGMVWVLSSPALGPQMFRLTSITETDPGQYQFTAVDHNPGKYDFVERAVPLPTSATSVGTRPRLPTGVQVTDELYLDAASVRVLLRVDFVPDSTANSHYLRYRRADSSWQTVGPLETPYAEIPNVMEGDYELEVWSKNILGMESAVATATYTVLGKSRPPADTAILGAELLPAGIQIALQPVTDLDFDVLEARWATTDVGWPSADLVDRVNGTTVLLTTAFGKGTAFYFYAKARDTSGNYSEGVATLEFHVEPPTPPRYVVAVANLGYVDAHWEAGERADFYELRAGDSWDTGEYIGKTSDLAYTFEWARPGNAVFWVESYDALGNASGRPAAVSKDIAKPSGRNVVYEVDYAGAGWPGRLLNLENRGISLDLAAGRFYGEYVSRFSLAYRHRVLLAMDGAVSAVYEDGTTWEDLDFPWDDPLADRPWWKPGDVAQVEVAHYIAIDTDVVDAGVVAQWTLEDSVAGTALATPVYAPGIFDSNGLQVDALQSVAIAQATDAVFTYHFWQVVAADYNARFLQLDGVDGTWLQIGYDADLRQIYARRSEGDVVTVNLTLAPNDPVFIGVAQDGASLRLFAQKHGIPYRYAEAIIDLPHGYDSLTLN